MLDKTAGFSKVFFSPKWVSQAFYPGGVVHILMSHESRYVVVILRVIGVT